MFALVFGVAQSAEWGWVDPDRRLPRRRRARVCLRSDPLCAATRAPRSPSASGATRTYVAANVVSLLFGAALFAWLLVGVLYLTSVWGYSELRAGLVMTPGALVADAGGRRRQPRCSRGIAPGSWWRPAVSSMTASGLVIGLVPALDAAVLADVAARSGSSSAPAWARSAWASRARQPSPLRPCEFAAAHRAERRDPPGRWRHRRRGHGRDAVAPRSSGHRGLRPRLPALLRHRAGRRCRRMAARDEAERPDPAARFRRCALDQEIRPPTSSPFPTTSGARGRRRGRITCRA